jgi:hypothetical protein
MAASIGRSRTRRHNHKIDENGGRECRRMTMNAAIAATASSEDNGCPIRPCKHALHAAKRSAGSSVPAPVSSSRAAGNRTAQQRPAHGNPPDRPVADAVHAAILQAASSEDGLERRLPTRPPGVLPAGIQSPSAHGIFSRPEPGAGSLRPSSQCPLRLQISVLPSN